MSVSICLTLPGTGGTQDQWDYALSNFKPDHLYVIGDEALAPETNVFSKLSATYIEGADTLPTGSDLVVMSPENGVYLPGEVSLADFAHPSNAIYLFGPDKHHLNDDDHLRGAIPNHLVYIPTDSRDNMWSWTAYCVTMWDRRMKHG